MYDGEHSIRFFDSEYAAGSWTFDDPKIPAEHPHTWKTWHLIPTGKPVVKPPENDMNMLKIPGRHGLINPNKYTFGRPVFGNRTGSIEFILDPDYIWNWPVIYSEILTYFHGQERLMVLRDDRFYYYKGWFTVSDLEPGEYFDTVTLDYSLEPFKYERFTSGDPPQLWDDFNFLTGVLRDYRSVKVSGVAGAETEPPLKIVDLNGLFGTDDVPEITGLNTAGVLSAAIAEGGPLHGLEAALEAVPIAVGIWVEYTPLPGETVINVSSRDEMVDKDKLYQLNNVVYKFSRDYWTAHLVKTDSQTDRDVLISQAFADVIDNLNKAADCQPLNADLGTETASLKDSLTELREKASAQLAVGDWAEYTPRPGETVTNILNKDEMVDEDKLYRLNNVVYKFSTWEISDKDLAVLLTEVLPGAYFQMQFVRTTAMRGIVQARSSMDSNWVNVFYSEPEGKSFPTLAVGGASARRFLYFRTTIDTSDLYLRDADGERIAKVDPLVTVSVRGNTL